MTSALLTLAYIERRNQLFPRVVKTGAISPRIRTCVALPVGNPHVACAKEPVLVTTHRS